MGIIEKHSGCSDPGKGCWGPVNEYYTIFGSELKFLTGHIIVSIILGLILFGVLFFLNKKGKIKLPLYLIIIIPIIVTVLLFFLFVSLFPVLVDY